jgi:2-(1,2-epoxy-1,2-dihydrophenyl)acetyl-CoA isomerase
MPATYQFLLTNQEGGVLTLTMNRPDVLNALNATLLGELGDELERAAADETVRCIVLTGAGRAFGSGQDLNDFATLYQSPGPIVVSEHLSRYHRILLAIQHAPKPVIAAVQGVAAGASCNLALACDLRIAADNARFIEAFARIGLVPDAGGGYLLPRLVGLGKAMELAMLADEVSGPEAERLGMVNRCVPAAELETTVRDLANRLANGPTTAYRLIKDLLYRSADSDLATSLRLEGELQDIAINTADHREAVTAFLAKRPPRYTGK